MGKVVGFILGLIAWIVIKLIALADWLAQSARAIHQAIWKVRLKHGKN